MKSSETIQSLGGSINDGCNNAQPFSDMDNIEDADYVDPMKRSEPNNAEGSAVTNSLSIVAGSATLFALLCQCRMLLHNAPTCGQIWLARSKVAIWQRMHIGECAMSAEHDHKANVERHVQSIVCMTTMLCLIFVDGLMFVEASNDGPDGWRRSATPLGKTNLLADPGLCAGLELGTCGARASILYNMFCLRDDAREGS